MQASRKMQPQPWIKARVKELPGKTLRGLGLAMGGLDGSRLTEIMAGTRRVQPAEVAPMAEYLEMAHDEVYGRLFGITPESRAKSEDHRLVANRVDSSPTVLIPLWEIALPGGTGSGDTLQLVKTASWVPAPQELRPTTSKDIFATQLWDDDHAPWVRRGATLFVNPSKKPRDGDWALFLQSADLSTGSILNPAVGILLARKGNSWAIQRGMGRLSLALADWPICWLIEFIKP